MFNNKFGAIVAKRYSIFAVAAALALAMFAATDGVVSAALAPPANFRAAPGAATGEILVRWDAVPGISGYRVCDQPANGEWYCANVPASDTVSLYTGLQVGATYQFAIQSYTGSERSRWVFAKATATAAAHLCPITGLPIPAGGYKSVGDTVRANGVSVRVNSVSFPADTGRDLTNDRRFIKICANVYGTDGAHYISNLDTDAGLSLKWEPRDNCLIYDIPAKATVAILAVRPWHDAVSSVDGHPFLYRFNVPAD